MNEGGERGIENSESRQTNPDAVHNQSSDKVVHDGAVASPSDCEGLHQL